MKIIKINNTVRDINLNGRTEYLEFVITAVIRSVVTLMLLVFSLSIHFSVAGPSKRVFDERDGLSGGAIYDINFDDYGFVWLATEQGLYRASSSMVRRIDKVGFESMLEHEKLTTVKSVDADTLFVSAFSANYLYDIHQNHFTKLAIKNTVQTQQQTHILKAKSGQFGQFYALSKNGNFFQLNKAQSRLDFEFSVAAETDEHWRDFVEFDDSSMLFIGKRSVVLVLPHRTQINLDWPKEYGEINEILVANNQVWLMASKGLFTVDIESKKITAIANMPYFLKAGVVDNEGMFWLGGYDGLIKWDPVKKLQINYQQQLKSATNINYVLDLAVDKNGLVWVGGSGGRLALLSPQPEFIRDSFTKLPPYQLPSELVWSIYSEQDTIWLGLDGGLAVVDSLTKQSQSITLDGFLASDSVYYIDEFDNNHLLITSTNGVYVINKHTHHSQSFGEFTGQEESLDNGIVLKAFKDKLINNRYWFPTTIGLHFWDKDSNTLSRLPLQNEGEGDLWVSDILRDQNHRLWIGGVYFGYLDEQLNFHSKAEVLERVNNNVKVSSLLEVTPNVLWLATTQHGLYEYDIDVDSITRLDQQWQVNCDVVYFQTQTATDNIVGCKDMIIKVNRQNGQIESFPLRDGMISDELNESAIFYREELGLFVGTTNGAMLIDPQLLTSNSAKEQIILESVSVYYDDTKSMSLVPKQNLSIKPDARLISFHIASLDFLDANPITLQYRLNLKGQKKDNYFLLEGQSQINISGLKAGHYTLELKYMRNGVWTDTPFTYAFAVEQSLWSSNHFKGFIVVIVFLCCVAVIIYRQRQINRFKIVNQALIESDDQLRQALKGSDSDLWEWKYSTQKVYLENRGGILGDTIKTEGYLSDIPIHPDDIARVTKAWKALIKSNKEMINVEYRFRYSDTQWRWLRIRGRVVSFNPTTKRLERAVGIYTDVTQQKQLESEIQLLAEAFENTSEGMLILDNNGNIKVSNAAADLILRASKEDLVTTPFSDLVVSGEKPLIIDQLFTQQSNWRGERQFKRIDGDTCPVWLNISMMLNSQGVPQHYVVVFSDITESKQNVLNLKHLANNDTLTGLGNRAMFSRQLSKVIDQPHPAKEKVALLFLDLDRFKHVNDSYGHSMGDALLIEAAKRLQACLAENHLLCRFGGDEFVVLLRDIDGVDQINQYAEKFQQQIEAPFNLQGREFFISTSIGISIWPDDSIDAESLIKNADLAMYHAKEEGRGLFRYYSAERNAESLYHLRLEADLRKAIELEEFELHYQPQVNILNDNKFVGMEALIRWEHPQDGYIRPDVFIAVAESSGLIVQIDRWVLRQACIDGARWRTKLEQPFRLSVNVSAVHFRQADFIDVLTRIMLETGMKAENLALEITEGVLMKELQVATENLSTLKKLGIEVAIDDFGTGYSSLAYLRNFEVNTLKIDRSFLIDISANKKDQAIVSSITELARNLQLDVVAEGIETKEQLEQVFARGCYIIQGYYFAKPMPRQALDEYLHITDASNSLR